MAARYFCWPRGSAKVIIIYNESSVLQGYGGKTVVAVSMLRDPAVEPGPNKELLKGRQMIIMAANIMTATLTLHLNTF